MNRALSSRRTIDLFRNMCTARMIDEAEMRLIQQGKASFHVSGAGHEATAALAAFLTPDDFLHLHYRDKALMVARGVPIAEFFRSLLALPNSHSAGRQMSAHMSWPEVNITSTVGPVGNNALQAVGTAAVLKEKGEGVSICALGDGTTQQGEFFEAVAEAVRLEVPVMFLIEDNGLAISTRTKGRLFFDGPAGSSNNLFGLPVQHFDGCDIYQTTRVFSKTLVEMRKQRRAKILVGKFSRLTSHTNSDDQSAYLDEAELSQLQGRDPIVHLRNLLITSGKSSEELAEIEKACSDEVQAALQGADKFVASPPTRSTRAVWNCAEVVAETEHSTETTIRQAINEVLLLALSCDNRVFLLGQDIEDPKGDVFGITKGLSSQFPARVQNATLSESTIIGTAIGRALAGQRPIAFIQFSDFLPLAANQILSELSTMFWRSNGGWSAPMVIMAPIGGYKPGLGPFHGESYEALLAQSPGLNVVCPSNAADAAGLLNAAILSPVPTLFLYPKALLNRREVASSTLAKSITPHGRARVLISGADLTLVGWGNTIPLCAEVASRFGLEGFGIDLIDLRSLSPWDSSTVIASAARTGRLVIAHEDRKSFGIGAEIAATVAEALGDKVRIGREARADSFIPFNFLEQLSLLPSQKSITEACAKLLGISVEWQSEREINASAIIAIGSGPADDEVIVTSLHVDAGSLIQQGDLVAVVEASKASIEILAPRAGVIDKVLCAVGDAVGVGIPIFSLREDDFDTPREQPKPPVQRAVFGARRTRAKSAMGLAPEIFIESIAVARGARRVTTEELCRKWPGRSVLDLIQTTGIRSRNWIIPAQSVQGLAKEALAVLLEQCSGDLGDLGLAIATTGTPDLVTPSLAARVCAPLGYTDLASYDLNAACSGYLYALHAAHNYLSSNPDRTVLILTSEVLSPLLDLDDPDTAVLFGDAASATLLRGRARAAMQQPRLRLCLPVISGRPETGELLSVPLRGLGSIAMNGRQVFAEAIRSMEAVLSKACEIEDISPRSLDRVVPHQANQRILAAIERRIGVPVCSVIESWGNTSSSSIPIALADLLESSVGPQRLGLAAFGGGLTAAAAVAHVV